MLRGGRVVCGCEHTSRAYDTRSAALRRSSLWRTYLCRSSNISPSLARAAPPLRSSAGSRAAHRGGDEEALLRRTSLALQPSNCYCTVFLSSFLFVTSNDRSSARCRGRGSASLFRCALHASRPESSTQGQMRRQIANKC